MKTRNLALKTGQPLDSRRPNNRRITGLVIATLIGASSAPAYARMDYRDAGEVARALHDLAQGSGHARIFTIGYSSDYRTQPNRPANYPIHALRISADTSTSKDDDLSKNGILFECGMHSREWLATESCLMFAEYLVANATNDRTPVPGLLASTDVWIVPLTNVSGRRIDDTEGGDPTRYSTSPSSAGWRGNGDTRECDRGVDIARNFSAGWSGAAADCAGDNASQYRGLAPFSTGEAVALRNFVQNHTISMVVIVHSNAQKVWNMWGDNDVAGAAISGLARLLWSLDLDDDNLNLARESVGNGMGQFSAWLTGSSNTAGEPDQNTMRGIQTVFVELPFSNYGDDYASPNGTGNGFHPSSDRVIDVIQRKFIPMASGLAAIAGSPGCVRFPGLACPDRDFGLVGAKLSFSANATGKLETTAYFTSNGAAFPARDYLHVGQYWLAYRVQNFSREQSSQDVDVRIIVDDGVNQESHIQSYRGLARAEARTGQLLTRVGQVNADYTVTVEARPAGGFASGVRDSFSSNDKKVFKFRSYQLQ